MFEEQVSSTSSSGYLNFSPGPNKENENKGRKRISDYIYETPNKKRHFQTAEETATEDRSPHLEHSTNFHNREQTPKRSSRYLPLTSLNGQFTPTNTLALFENAETSATSINKEHKSKKFIQFRSHFLATLNVHTLLENVIPKYPRANSFVLKGLEGSLFLVELYAQVVEILEEPSRERLAWVVRVSDLSCKPTETLLVEHWREPEDLQPALVVNETYRFIGNVVQRPNGEKILRCCWLVCVKNLSELKYSNVISDHFLSLCSRKKENRSFV